MKPKTLACLVRVVMILVILAGWLPASPVAAAPRPEVDTATSASTEPAPPGPEGLRYGYNAQTGKVSFIGGDASAPLLPADEVGAMAVEEADGAVLRRYAGQFGIQNPAAELRLQAGSAGASGGDAATQTRRYQQHFQGIPVLGGEMLINRDGQGNVISLNGEVSPDLALGNTTPGITSEQAVQAALAGAREWHGLSAEQLSATAPELWIYDPRILVEDSTRPIGLVWRLEVRSVDAGKLVRELVLVDAASGEIALHFNQIDTGWGRPEQEPTPEPEATALPEESPTPEPTAEFVPEDVISTETPTLTTGPFSGEPALEETVEPQAEFVMYLSPNGADLNNCTSPSLPCKTLSYAVAHAEANSRINMQSGLYREGDTTEIEITTLDLLTISGGWNQQFTAREGYSTITGTSQYDGVYYYFGGNQNLHVDITNIIFLYGTIRNLQNLVIHESAFIDSTPSIINWGQATIINTTFTGTSRKFNMSLFDHGAIENQSAMTLQNVTVAHHQTAGYYGGYNSSLYVRNSIFANNYQTCYSHGPVVSAGYNILDETESCGNRFVPSPTDLLGVDPLLTPYPIHKQHIQLRVGSPAIDAIDMTAPDACPLFDQRGVPRPIGEGCDIGAVEYRPAGSIESLEAVHGSVQTAGPNLPFPAVIAVMALDSNDEPVADAVVTFTAPTSGASLIFSDTSSSETQRITDQSGVATISTLVMPNLIRGRYSVNVTSDGARNALLSFGNWDPIYYIDSATGDDHYTPPQQPCSITSPCKTIRSVLEYLPEGGYARITSPETDYSIDIDRNYPYTLSGGWDSTFENQIGYTPLVRAYLSNVRGEMILDGFNFSSASIFQNQGTLLITNSRIEKTTLTNYSNLSLRSVTLTNAGFLNSSGFAILDQVAFVNNTRGIDNFADLTLNNSVITQNNEGIVNHGNLTSSNTLISNNSSNGFINQGGTTTLLNVTVSNHYKFSKDTRYVNTITSTGILNQSGIVRIQNSVIANNQTNIGWDCYGPIESLGYNLIGVADYCAITPTTGDVIGTRRDPIHPRLGEFQQMGDDYVQLLMEGSPGLDSADPNACPAVDIRGVPRPEGLGCDRGAFEGSLAGEPDLRIWTFTSNKTSQWPGTLLCSTPQIDCAGGKNIDADLAHTYTIGIDQLYRQQHHRMGVNNGGQLLISTVDNTDYYNNAAWNGYQVIYGPGSPRADDVVAHEITHAVTESTSNLFYVYQSGAINESLSDLWGEYYDQTNDHGNDAAEVRWLLGEEMPQGATRDMSDPPAFKDPDKMTSPYYHRSYTDSGGVHINSGINNKAVFLMVDGGVFNNRTVLPLGSSLAESWGKVADIYYYAQTHLLTSGAGYLDLYHAVNQSCSVLAAEGSAGITPSDCQQVLTATEAVEMNKPVSRSFIPQVQYCPAGFTKVPDDLFFDGFENDEEQWEYAANQGTIRWGVIPGPIENLEYAATGRYALFGENFDDELPNGEQVSDSYAVMKTGVRIPKDIRTYMRFNHAYMLEFGVYVDTGNKVYFDGGVLEYSLNNGATWRDSSTLAVNGQAYNGSVYRWSGAWSNPLRGRAAFVGDSHGYVSSRYDLTPLAGQTVRFRWRLGTDYSYGRLGWAVDDVTIYNCAGTPKAPVLSYPSNDTLVKTYQPRLDWADTTYAHIYDLEIATDSGFANLVTTQTGLTTSEYTLTEPLPTNMRYYWRVRAVNLVGIQSPWSSTRSFRTTLLPPQLTAPAAGATVNSLRPQISWSESPGAASYVLWLSTYSNYSSPSVSITLPAGGSLSYTPTQDLPLGKKIYGRIMAKGANPSAWTAFTFTTPRPPSLPAPLSPVKNALLTSPVVPSQHDPTLRWKAATTPTGAPPFDHYELQVSDQPDYVSLLYPSVAVDTSSLITTSFTIPDALLDNHTYYWRVRAWNQNGDFSSWGASSFRTAILTPELLSPIDKDPGILSRRPIYNWTTREGAVSYTVVVSTYSNLSTPLLSNTVIEPPFIPPADLPAGKKLYWRVRANGANGPSLWSPTWSLTTPRPPSVPVRTAPATDALLTSTENPPVYTPMLAWKAVTVPTGASPFSHYELQVSDQPDFSALLYPNAGADTTHLTGTTYTLPVSLPANLKVYWRMRAHNQAGEHSAWAASSFRTALAAPALLAPVDDPATPLNNQRPAFSWQAVSGTASYTIVVSASSGFSSPLVNKTLTAATYTPTANLPDGKVLYWRVRANGANGPSAWSATWRFKAK